MPGLANQAAVLIHTRPGTEVVIDQAAHLVNFEEGGAAAWSGVQLRGVESPDGIPDPEAFTAAIRGTSPFVPETSLLCLENTHNAAGGKVIPVERVAEAYFKIGERFGFDWLRRLDAQLGRLADLDQAIQASKGGSPKAKR